MPEGQVFGARETEVGPMMLSIRQTAVAVGVLFLTATATFLTADSLVRGVLSRPDFLIGAAGDAAVLYAGALLALVCGLVDVGIAVLVYPLLKHHSERLALGYVGLRVGELGPVLLYAVTPLLVVALGADSHDGNVDTFAANQFGLLLQALFDVALKMVYLFTGASGIVFAYLLYRTKLIPRPIAVLGACPSNPFERMIMRDTVHTSRIMGFGRA